MYPQWANIPLQGLDRCVLTVGAVSGPRCQIVALHWCHFTSLELTWLAKSTLEKQTSSHQPVQAVNMHCYLVQLPISWDNEMNFSLYANMADYHSTVTYYSPLQQHKLVCTYKKLFYSLVTSLYGF